MITSYTQQAADLLRQLIAIPSFSGEESARVQHLLNFFKNKQMTVQLIENNLLLRQPHHDSNKPTLMLNSHLDTVQPATGYTFNPHQPPQSSTHIYGLGSNDAGASVVSLLYTFLHYYNTQLPFNLLLALTAEEENSGPKGMRYLWPQIKEEVDMAIIGEPTQMQGAIAERGLLVIDAVAKGKSGHAARNEGINALYIALEDINTLRNFQFDKISPTMGNVKLTVTQINSGTQHNVVPDLCNYVIDIRPTELYNNPELMELLQAQVQSQLTARNLTNRSSATPATHPLMKAVEQLSIETYLSPTTSDWMRITCPAIKMGPGHSSRSHQADEYILIDELKQGIDGYIKYIQQLKQTYNND